MLGLQPLGIASVPERMIKKLFILEDEEISQYIMKAILQQFKGFKTTYFDDGLSLIDHLIRHVDQPAYLPDVIFVDLNMPGLNGWDVLDAIRHMTQLLYADIPVYIISTSVSPIDRQRALAYPFVRDFFFKPVRTALIRQVESFLDSSPRL